MWLRELVTKVLINPIIRTRTHYFRRAYHPTCDSMVEDSNLWYHIFLRLTVACLYLWRASVCLLLRVAYQHGLLAQHTRLSAVVKVMTYIFCWIQRSSIDLRGFWRWCMLYRAIGLVLDFIQSPKRCGIFCRPHTRRWIKSKTSPIALYKGHHLGAPIPMSEHC
jgi:hypothetical protein